MPLFSAIRDKWTVGGTLPGEPPQPIELGLNAPSVGLYLREDVDMRCNVIMTGFVKKTLKKAHAVLVERLKVKAEIACASRARAPRSNSPEPLDTLAVAVGVPINVNSRPTNVLAGRNPSAGSSSSVSSWDSVSPISSSSSVYSQSDSSLASAARPWVVTGTTKPVKPFAENSPTARLNCNASFGKQYIPWPSPDVAAPIPTKMAPDTPFLSGRTPDFSLPAVPILPAISIPLVAEPEPETPFLCSNQPDWPLKSFPSNTSTTPTYLTSSIGVAVESAAAMDSLAPRLGQPQLGKKNAFKPYPGQQRDAKKTAISIVPPVSDCTVICTGKLSDDKLWQALGGGERKCSSVAVPAGNVNGVGSSSSSGSNLGLAAPKGQERFRSQDDNYSYNKKNWIFNNASSCQYQYLSHPDYPHMSPYDNENGTAGSQVKSGVTKEDILELAPAPLQVGRTGGERLSRPFIPSFE